MTPVQLCDRHNINTAALTGLSQHSWDAITAGVIPQRDAVMMLRARAAEAARQETRRRKRA